MSRPFRFWVIACALLCFAGVSNSATEPLRQQVLDYVRQSLDPSDQPMAKDFLPGDTAKWDVTLEAYSQGNLLLKAGAEEVGLEGALAKVVEDAKRQNNVSPDQIKESRLFISVVSTAGKAFSLVEYHGRALEVTAKDMVVVRSVDKGLIRAKIREGKEYLLRVMDPQHHGFYKLYDALRDKPQKRLRTIYSASSLWTLMKINDWEADERITQRIQLIAEFLLSMQAGEGPMQGAFHYSFSPKNNSKEPLFVVGTASKTIFTLLDLYRRFGEPRYLEAVQRAGDWLLTTQKENGTVTTTYHYKDGKWIEGKRFSTLYHGQVLSALSRLYLVTRDDKYLAGASKLADIMMKRARAQNYFLQDDYRFPTDPVPTTWGIMSLLDYYKATASPEAKEILWNLANQVMARQHKDPEDISNHGQYDRTAASGSGWVNEVFSELYLYGLQEGWNQEDLMRVKQSILLVTRWLIQNTYSPENTYFLKNPQNAVGGLIRNPREETVRTDAVCHGVNGYLYMLDQWPEGTLLEVQPESAVTHQ